MSVIGTNFLLLGLYSDKLGELEIIWLIVPSPHTHTHTHSKPNPPGRSSISYIFQANVTWGRKDPNPFLAALLRAGTTTTYLPSSSGLSQEANSWLIVFRPLPENKRKKINNFLLGTA